MRNSVLRPWILLTALTVAVVGVYFRPVLFQGEIFYGGDIARIYLPHRIASSRALASGSLPWWTPNIGAGYPLLAEGEVGALYPLHWLLDRFLPPELALNASIILHYILAGAGFFGYARTLGTSRKAAYFGALVLTLGGFYVAHLSHVSIIATAAWLPWMFALTHRLLAPRDGERRHLLWTTLGLGVVTGLQFLTGHPQISLLGLMALAAYALFVAWPGGLSRMALRGWGCWVGALFLGVALAAPQLWATAELTGLSQRAGGLDSAFFTSYSLHPALLATLVSPFLLGNPYPHGSVELMGYVGLLPLALASHALRHSRSRAARFFLGLALAGIFLALGRWNPLYQYLRLVPFLNLFRVPARYLYWTSFALATLSALGLEELIPKAQPTTRIGWGLLGVSGLALSAVLVSVWSAADVEQLVAHWRWLPAILMLATLSVIVAKGHSAPPAWTLAAYSALLVDLYAYGNVLARTYSPTMPREKVVSEPRSLSFFAQDKGLYRIYVKEEILPALSVMRESFYPNLALASGLSSANIYQPLVPRDYGRYLDSLNAQRLNRLNVKYYLIPQLLPVDEDRELYDVQNPFASLPANIWLSVPPTDLVELEIESYLSHSVGYENGHMVAELLFRDASGREVGFPVRAGIETAEWAYEREDVRAQILHQMPPVATTFPARSGFPPQEHPGHTYLARVRPDEPLRVVAVMWRPLIPEAFVRVERVRLIGALGEEKLVAHLVGLGDHSIVYRSEDVLIYRNEDVLPRAYTLPSAAVKLSDGEVSLPEVLSRKDVGPVEILYYGDTYVSLRARLEAPGYLVLADLAYPGWRATVDGAEAPLLRAEGIFRALALPPGEHHIVFEYKPTLFRRLLGLFPDLRAQIVWNIIAA